MCSQRSSKQRIRLNLPISAFYPHFSVLSPFQRFIPISAFYPHFSVLSPFQRFIPISAFYPHFSVLSPFQFPLSVSVSAIQFQRFIPTPSACSSIGVTCGQTRSQALLFCVGVFFKLFRYAQYLSQNVNYSFLDNLSIV